MTYVVLIVGSESLPSAAYASVLRAAGYTVIRAEPETSLAALNDGDYDLAVLCSDIPEQQKVKLIIAMRAERAMLPILSLDAGLQDIRAPLLAHSTDALAGPTAFLARVKELLIGQGSVSPSGESEQFDRVADRCS